MIISRSMGMLRILGCSGGIGLGCRTTSFLLGERTLLDAGTGVTDLPLDQLASIDRVFLTHSHLDHVVSLPLMMDAVGNLRFAPIKVYAQLETLDALRKHLFNDAIWPDFTQIFVKGFPVGEFHPITIGETVPVNDSSGQYRVTAIPATHTVAACGYAVSSGKGTLVYTGDTWSTDDFWEIVNQIADLQHLIIETSFSDNQKHIADLSQHLTPSRLAAELSKMKSSAKIHITHLKPGDEAGLMREIVRAVSPKQVSELRIGDVIRF